MTSGKGVHIRLFSEQFQISEKPSLVTYLDPRHACQCWQIQFKSFKQYHICLTYFHLFFNRRVIKCLHEGSQYKRKAA